MIFNYALAADTVPGGIWSGAGGSYYPPYVITVDKSRKKLSVWKTDVYPYQLVKEYDSDQGQNAGAKMASGDKKTPEGIYFFNEQKDGYKVNFDLYGVRIFTMDYPNLFDKRAGKTGYGIWLHAVPDTVPLSRGSRGCVVIRNDDILEISNNITLKKTPILVFNHLDMMPLKEHKKLAGGLEAFIKSWQNAWESKDITSYMSHYAEDFYSSRMNKEKWQSYKQKLNTTYEKISVSFSDPVIYEVDGNILVRSLQRYSSDQHEDFGEKFLYIQRKQGLGFKIVAEEWSPVEKDIVQAELGANSFLSKTRAVSSSENTN
ncbi:MAG: L,D-transpeptidase family protein [Bdellovibrionales bacterium]|nr:L,D-transpeptidase family protein [Bdellovibrionales bacterium]